MTHSHAGPSNKGFPRAYTEENATHSHAGHAGPPGPPLPYRRSSIRRSVPASSRWMLSTWNSQIIPAAATA